MSVQTLSLDIPKHAELAFTRPYSYRPLEHETPPIGPLHREKRYDQSILKHLAVSASITTDHELVPIKIENFSEFGLGCTLTNHIAHPFYLKIGEIIKNLTFQIGQTIVFSGQVQVIHVSPENQPKFGVKCTRSPIALQTIFSLIKKNEYESKLSTFIEVSKLPTLIDASFKIAVSDFRYFLEAMKAHLLCEDEKIKKIPDQKMQWDLEQHAINAAEKNLNRITHDLILEIERISENLSRNERRLYRKYFQSQLSPLVKDAAIARRALEKPLGYPGDYEMMNMIYGGGLIGNTLWEKLINSCITNISPGLAVQNRVQYLTEKIEEAIRENKAKQQIHIMSIACGPCEEVWNFLRHMDPQSFQDVQINFYFIDNEPLALEYAQKRLRTLTLSKGLAVNLYFIQCDFASLINNQSFLPNYSHMDLIYSSGLFEYLPSSNAKSLLDTILLAANNGARLVIGNFAKNYKYRSFVEFAMEWYIFHRTPEELLDLLPIPKEAHCKDAYVEHEPEGVNLFLNILKHR